MNIEKTRTDIQISTGFNNMGRFVSREKLLFTHKPLVRRITALRRNLIKFLSEGAGKIQKPLVFLHFSAFLIYSHSTVAGGLLVMS